MVECSPGPEGGLTPPHNDSTGNSLENGTAAPGSQELDSTPQSNAAHEPVVPTKTACSRVIPFIRSKSDGTIGASVSPSSITAKVHPGRFHGAEDRRQKQELFFGGRIAIQEEHDGRKSADESDTFLSASMQLMHLNGEARQRVRQLWTSMQRLGRENQISESGMDVLYVELSNILKSISAEKLEGTKPLKSGCLVLLASSPASDPSTISSGAAVKALFGSRPTAQLMQCTLSEDQSKFEMTPVRLEAVPANAQTSTSNRFGLPSKASLMGMISEAFQEEPTTRAIKLQGCQVRRFVPKSPSNEVTADDGTVAKAKILHRFQLLVPYKTQMSAPADGVGADILFPTRAPVPYESFIFEVPVPTPGDGGTEADFDAQAEVDDWVLALDRVCRFQLHRLEHALREAPNLERYRETLQRHFPVSVSVSWLRNRVDQPTLQRRSSANLSMIQIVKDLGRDKVLLDDQLFSAANPYECDDMESDSVSEVVKYMVRKVLQFEQDVASQTKEPGKPGVPAAPSHQPSSPAHRFAKNCEARALAFVERVLQGSSRTQSGGDIYDAISFFCQQEHVSICPVSQDARPVQMRLITDVTKGIFQVEVQVCMQFKVIELTPRSPTPAPSNEDGAASFDPDSATLNSPRDSMREWAVLEGTLSREFTLGKLAAPGTVTINCTSSSDN
ncbi:hypothetical protein PF005_g13791 [Phytophthora fragariae]|uniref:Uncharacterized protein n=1 Tax=Phytophthora fragariae TaxID=53985 RepID=A0A6A4DAK5_9STRA|nr:hypothetical protein PF003_g38822 [Phytophthora fragariae]KAE8934782.1 hypothetical protein PF009_g15251 [Phytophthora fragariae]KAE9008613.1 hypothetical protein PF011_g10633 [Phytophthora fragariae]KAE9104175.1 hypothetical protein PF007_g14142 [Phytophthora fragariae]KAE9142904.1 hypothetical protein PF006_g12023 [Phytophthora fragariae]